MRIAAKRDIEAPVEHGFAYLSDWPHWERAAIRRGAGVRRDDGQTKIAPGATWQIQIVHRGKLRNVTVTLDDLVAPVRLVFTGLSDSFDARVDIDLIPLTPRRSRLHVVIELKPKTISARVFVQTLRLTRTRLERRLSLRMDQIAFEIESRLHALRARTPV